MSNERNRYHGEGDPEAAERFNEAETAFVESARGKRAVRKGRKVRPEEEAAVRDAEQRGRERSKGDDPAARMDKGSK